MKNDQTAQALASINRRKNLLKYVRDNFHKDPKIGRTQFQKEFKKRLEANNLWAGTAKSHRNSISKTLSQDTKLPLSREKAEIVEALFNLQAEYLSRMSEKKAPAYILLQCKAHTAEKLLEEISQEAIVDEVAVLIGDADLFIRVYGTQDEVKEFLLDRIFNIARKVASMIPTLSERDAVIDRTKTYLSFEDSYTLRFHPKDNIYFRKSVNDE